MTTITPAKMCRNGGAPLSAFVQLTSLVEGGRISFTGADGKLLVLVKNEGSTTKTVTFYGGNGPQGCGDLTENVPAGSTRGFCFDSGYFKQVSGADKGTLRYTTQSTDVKLSAILLP